MLPNNQPSSIYQQTNNNNDNTFNTNEQQSKHVEKFDTILATFNHNRKIDRLFYDAVNNIIWYNNAQWMFNFIRLFFILFTLIFGLANHLIDDNKILAFVILALCGSTSQFLSYLLFRHVALRDNKVFIKMANEFGHLTNQPITENIQILENCVSNTIYNLLTQQNITYYESLSDEEKRKNSRVVADSIQNMVKINNQGFKYFSDFCQLVGLASFIFGVVALSLCQTTPKPGILIPIILFLIIQGLYKLILLFYLAAISIAIGLFPIILIVVIVIVCRDSPTNQQGQKVNLPLSVKSTEFMINQAGGNCSICFQSFGLNKDVIQLRCSPKHMYHPLCIKAWTQVKSNCPICRAQINSVRDDSVRVQLQG